MHGLKSESCLRAHDECGIRFERQSSRPKCPQNSERSSFDITLVGTADPQPTNFEPLPTRLPTLPKKNLHCAKTISTNLTHLSFSLLNNKNNNENTTTGTSKTRDHARFCPLQQGSLAPNPYNNHNLHPTFQH